jgi:putative glutamine amidotransferase
MARPLIGLTTYTRDVKYSTFDTESVTLPTSYVRAIHSSGGRAVLIPSDDPGEDVLDRLDGIVFTGGSDVDPVHYGEAAHPESRWFEERDRAELLLVRAALDRDLPLLGVCRGFQLMAIAAGGKLHQHLPDVFGHGGHRLPPGETHRVQLTAGTRCHKILGDEVAVNSIHHQGVSDPGTLTPAGWCPGDDLLEAAEDPTRSFAIGVQWHPEMSTDLRVFAALVEAALVGAANH